MEILEFLTKGLCKKNKATDGENLGNVANILFGTRSIHALGAAKVMLDILRPRPDDLQEMDTQTLADIIKNYISKCYEPYEGSLQGVVSMQDKRNVLFNILFGPDVANFIQPENLAQAKLSVQDVAYDKEIGMFVPILNTGESVEHYMWQNLGVNVFGRESEEQGAQKVNFF